MKVVIFIFVTLSLLACDDHNFHGSPGPDSSCDLVPVCAYFGACTTTADCVQTNKAASSACSTPTCGSQGFCCNGDGAACNDDAECCPGMSCQQHTCSTAPPSSSDTYIGNCSEPDDAGHRPLRPVTADDPCGVGDAFMVDCPTTATSTGVCGVNQQYASQGFSFFVAMPEGYAKTGGTWTAPQTNVTYNFDVHTCHVTSYGEQCPSVVDDGDLTTGVWHSWDICSTDCNATPWECTIE